MRFTSGAFKAASSIAGFLGNRSKVKPRTARRFLPRLLASALTDRVVALGCDRFVVGPLLDC